MTPEEFKRKLRSIPGSIEGELTVPASDVFTDSFVRSHSDFDTLAEMLAVSGRENIEDFHNNEVEDSFFLTHTRFRNYREFYTKGCQEFVIARKIRDIRG